MDKNGLDNKTLQLVLDAQEGDRASLGQLAELAQGRLLSYIYRLTLDYELAQELCQQTQLKMVESIGTLRRADRFWFWLFRTAMGLVQHHYRDLQREYKVQIAALDKRQWEEGLAQVQGDGLDQVSRLELTEIVVDVIMKMRLSYRNILILRCFEQMSYAQIAEFMGCKELRVRVLLYRAKHALRQQLARRGITQTALGAGLTLFGLLTLHSKGAATTVSVASLDVGLIGATLGALGTKMGLVLMSCLGTLIVGITLEKAAIAGILCFAVLVMAALVNFCVDP